MRWLWPLLASLLLLGCDKGEVVGAAPTPATPTPAEAAPAGVRPFGVEVGYQAPEFRLQRLTGEGELALSELRGKVVLLTFWASWCVPCRHEVPALEAGWKERQGEDFTIVGLSIDNEADDAREFLKMFPVTYPLLLDPAGAMVANPWGAQSIPLSVVLDKDGVVRRRHLGYTPAQLRDTWREIDELL